jgi:ABC-type uncharacterized transport system substrate-binding protein
MISKIKLLLAITFVGLVSTYLISYNYNRKIILVLDSYNTDYIWTKEVGNGLDRILDKSGNVIIRRVYMDTKNHPEEGFKKRAGVQARQIIDQVRPDILIALDDNAQNYAAKYYVNDSKIKIVFAGVNTTPDKYGYDKGNNVTGILERNQLGAVRDAIILLAKNKKIASPIRLVNIGDKSNSVKLNEAFIKKFDWDPLQLTDSILVDTFDAWKELIFDLQDKADYIYTTNYRTLQRSADITQRVPAEEVIGWTIKNSKIPIVGSHGFFVEDGGPLALATSPFEQGETAASIALDLINGIPIAEIPIRTTKQFVVFMRQDKMERLGMSLPPTYEAFARAANKYYE